MAQFTVNATRFDPYKNFKFRVKWDGKYVAGISKVGALKRTTEVVKHREGGDPSSSRKSPGRTEYEAITLERGVTHDSSSSSGRTRCGTTARASAPRSRSKDFRKDLIIELYNESGQLVIAYKVFRCWVSEFQAMADLDANANAVADPAHQARERGLAARHRHRRAGRGQLYRAGLTAMTAVPTSARLLGVWERGVDRTATVRGLLLFEAAVPEAEPQALAAAPIGQRDAWLLSLRESLFGSTAECLTDCAACGEAIEVAFDTRTVRVPAAEAQAFELVAAGRHLACRLPNSGDLLAIEGAADLPTARTLLLARCTGATDLTPEQQDGVEAALAARDPQAEVLLDLVCPACATPTLAPFDIVRQLWSDLDDWAQAMLRTVDALACRYHWSEAAILDLSPARRDHYLALAGAA